MRKLTATLMTLALSFLAPSGAFARIARVNLAVKSPVAIVPQVKISATLPQTLGTLSQDSGQTLTLVQPTLGAVTAAPSVVALPRSASLAQSADRALSLDTPQQTERVQGLSAGTQLQALGGDLAKISPKQAAQPSARGKVAATLSTFWDSRQAQQKGSAEVSAVPTQNMGGLRHTHLVVPEMADENLKPGEALRLNNIAKLNGLPGATRVVYQEDATGARGFTVVFSDVMRLKAALGSADAPAQMPGINSEGHVSMKYYGVTYKVTKDVAAKYRQELEELHIERLLRIPGAMEVAARGKDPVKGFTIAFADEAAVAKAEEMHPRPWSLPGVTEQGHTTKDAYAIGYSVLTADDGGRGLFTDQTQAPTPVKGRFARYLDGATESAWATMGKMLLYGAAIGIGLMAWGLPADVFLLTGTINMVSAVAGLVAAMAYRTSKRLLDAGDTRTIAGALAITGMVTAGFSLAPVWILMIADYTALSAQAGVGAMMAALYAGFSAMLLGLIKNESGPQE
jgi:hypothetical protein